jgi:hypothetical protein
VCSLNSLNESAGGYLHTKVKEVFEELDEKPFFKAERVGNSITNRPVKVTMDSSLVVSNLLKKSKDLKKVQSLAMFISSLIGFWCNEKSTGGYWPS